MEGDIGHINQAQSGTFERPGKTNKEEIAILRKVIFLILRFYTSFDSKAIEQSRNVDNLSREKERNRGKRFSCSCLHYFLTRNRRESRKLLVCVFNQSTLHLSQFLSQLAIIVLIKSNNLWSRVSRLPLKLSSFFLSLVVH